MNESVEITVEVRRETAMALYVYDGTLECWIPKSQVKLREDLKGGVEEITIPFWLATEKGLI